MEIYDNPLIIKFRSLELPPDDVALFGSAPMFAHGIKDLGHDIDAVARGKAWELACEKGKRVSAGWGGFKIEFFEGEIELFDTWGPGSWDTNELIDSAEVIEGIRFVTLENVLKWKKMMNREKDVEHIRLIEEYLRKK